MRVNGKFVNVAAGIAVSCIILLVLELLLKWSSHVLTRHEHLMELNLLLETLAHATTGVVFWMATSFELQDSKSIKFMMESTCFVLVVAVVIDIDHFIAAGSFSIEVGLVYFIL